MAVHLESQNSCSNILDIGVGPKVSKQLFLTYVYITSKTGEVCTFALVSGVQCLTPTKVAKIFSSKEAPRLVQARIPTPKVSQKVPVNVSIGHGHPELYRKLSGLNVGFVQQVEINDVFTVCDGDCIAASALVLATEKSAAVVDNSIDDGFLVETGQVYFEKQIGYSWGSQIYFKEEKDALAEHEYFDFDWDMWRGRERDMREGAFGIKIPAIVINHKLTRRYLDWSLTDTKRHETGCNIDRYKKGPSCQEMVSSADWQQGSLYGGSFSLSECIVCGAPPFTLCDACVYVTLCRMKREGRMSSQDLTDFRLVGHLWLQ